VRRKWSWRFCKPTCKTAFEHRQHEKVRHRMRALFLKLPSFLGSGTCAATGILNDLHLGWCTGAGAKGLVVVAAGSRFVMPFRYERPKPGFRYSRISTFSIDRKNIIDLPQD
jgi:hypothetical protein